MTTNHKLTVLSTEDKITTCEHLDNGSFKSEIACEYKVANCSYLFHVYLFDYPYFFDYLNKPWSQGGRIIKRALYFACGLHYRSISKGLLENC